MEGGREGGREGGGREGEREREKIILCLTNIKNLCNGVNYGLN